MFLWLIPLGALPILKGCHTGDTAEGSNKGGGMFESYPKADLQKGQTLADQGLAHDDAPLADVVGDRGVEMLFKKAGDIFPAVIKMVCHLTYGGDFRNVEINILLQFKNLMGQ